MYLNQQNYINIVRSIFEQSLIICRNHTFLYWDDENYY